MVSKGSNSIPLKPISFSLDGFPNSGAWKQEFPVEGCGNDTILNFYFVVGSDAKINVIVAFPGSSHADLQLQNDALTYAKLGATSKAKLCQHFDVKNIRFEGFGFRMNSIPTPDQTSGSAHGGKLGHWSDVGARLTYLLPSVRAKGTVIVQGQGKVIER